mmetsp:Transcript_16687/g.30209  ORF Transcript_16687/g.30209 Transcript_16687/m.30209 type:complete len:83 (-) Transcript_16687:2058-2306(-)
MNFTVPDRKKEATNSTVDAAIPRNTEFSNPMAKAATIMTGTTSHSILSLVFWYDLKNHVAVMSRKAKTINEEKAAFGMYPTS